MDSTLTVKKHYVNDAAKIERVELSDGTKVFDINDFTAVKLTSGYGSVGADTYDGSRDNVDGILQGGGGSDVYILGRSFGNDTIDEGYLNSGKGDVDVVRLKFGLDGIGCGIITDAGSFDYSGVVNGWDYGG